jgi:signal transduction histidine kinase
MEQTDHFLALLGHELRSPLAALMSALAISRRRGPDCECFAWFQGVVERQVAQMTRLAEDLLDVSRVTSCKLTLQRERFDLGALVCIATDDLRAAILEAGLKLNLEVEPEPIWLDGDSARLHQVVSNLVGNAVKFTEEGGWVRVRARREAEAEFAQLIVEDTGIGLGPELKDHLFQAYVQGNGNPVRERRGLGLGLALAKAIVELHGGTITAASAGPGKGTTMTVRLPLGAGCGRTQCIAMNS